MYHVETDFKLGMDVEVNGVSVSSKDNIWPVCLPKNDIEFTSKRGMLAGWLDTPPIQQTQRNQLGSGLTGEGVLRTNFFSRVTGLEIHDECKDPEYQRAQGVNTFYPSGTVCSVDPSFGK